MPVLLLVSESEDVIQRITAMAESAVKECAVITVCSCADAVEKVLASRPDMVLVDTDLPGDGSSGLCGQLKRTPLTKDIPFILLTGARADTRARISALHSGVDGFLPKSCDEPECAVMIRTMARLKRAAEIIRRDDSIIQKGSAALRESKSRLAQIVNGSSIPTFVIDRNHRITHWNMACENLTGVSHSDEMGSKKQWLAFYASEKPVLADFIIDNASEDDIKRHYGGKCRKSSVISGAYEAEGFFPDLGGSGKWLFFTASPISDEDGRVVGAIETLQDITERKQAEEALRESEARLSQIVYGSSIATFVIDRNHCITHWNKACESLTRVTEKQVLGTKKQWIAFYASKKPVMADLIVDNASPDTISSYYEGRARKSAAIQGAYEVEAFFPDLGNGGRWIFITASPIKDARGVISGSIETMQDVTERKMAEEMLRSELAGLEHELRERHTFQNIIGKSGKMQELYSLIENLADTETTVLITGESGTGKEMVAKALHYSGSRARKTLVMLNCSALTETLLESELFGHVKGAFTGALRDKVGRFQLADGGTILLDEIGDISPRIQLKLLRVLQEKEFERVGDASPQKVNVRVIAATNCDLRAKVQSGEFREDLYYRLKVVEIHMPPLRERLEDIPLLAEHFFRVFREKTGKNISDVDAEVMQLFMCYPWPGNVRELEHAMEHAFILCQSKTIRPECLPPEIREYSGIQADASNVSESSERANLVLALSRSGWNKAKAARLMGISRPTLYSLIRKHSIRSPE